jgi:hypothetical protein
MTYYAVMHDTGRCIASGETYLEASDAALSTGIWKMEPGTCAPYFLTTIKPLCKAVATA